MTLHTPQIINALRFVRGRLLVLPLLRLPRLVVELPLPNDEERKDAIPELQIPRVRFLIVFERSLCRSLSKSVSCVLFVVRCFYFHVYLFCPRVRAAVRHFDATLLPNHNSSAQCSSDKVIPHSQ